MKTMKQEGKLPIRVKESEVDSKLAQGFVFCPKSEWKDKVRNVKVEKPVETEDRPKSKGKSNPKGKAKKTKQMEKSEKFSVYVANCAMTLNKPFEHLTKEELLIIYKRFIELCSMNILQDKELAVSSVGRAPPF